MKVVNKKIQASILAGVLLTPSILAPIAEAATTTEQLPTKAMLLQATPEELKTQLTTLIAGLNENSTREDITLASSYMADDLTSIGFTNEEQNFMQAKLVYVEAYFTYNEQIRQLGLQMARLTPTSATLYDDYKNSTVESDLNQLFQKTLTTNQTYENVVKATSNAILNQFLGDALQYGNGDINQRTYFKNKGADIQTFEQTITDLQEAVPVIDQLRAIEKATDLMAIEADVKNTREEYNNLRATAKKIAELSITPTYSTAAYQHFINVEKSLNEAKTLSEKIHAIATKNYKTSVEYTREIDNTAKVYATLPKIGQDFVNQMTAHIMPTYIEESAIVKQVTTLKPTNKPEYRTQLKEIAEQATTFKNTRGRAIFNEADLNGALDVVTRVEAVEEKINTIQQAKDIVEARSAYNALDKTEQRIVTNLKVLIDKEKTIKHVQKLDQDIAKVRPLDKNFAARMTTLNKIYVTLTDSEQALLSNKAQFEAFLPFAQLTKSMNDLKPGKAGYEKALQQARQQYDALEHITLPTELAQHDEAIAKLKSDALKKLDVLENEQATVAVIIDQIKKLDDKNLSKNDYIATLKEAREKLDLLPSAIKKQVTNTKDLQKHEKEFNAVLKVIDQIAKLDEQARDFANKLKAANKAYDKLSTQHKEYVTNYTFVEQANQYVTVIEAINKLKPASKTFRADVTKAQEQYKALENSHQPKITNYKMLVNYQYMIEQADLFDAKIESLLQVPPENMLEEVAKLTKEYQRLPADVKRQVQNAKSLTDYEKENKAVLKVVQLIQNLDPNQRDYTRKVEAARKAYDALEPISKSRVTNYNDLKLVEPVAYLMGDIASLKPSSKTYSKDVEQLRKAYDALNATEQRLIKNYYLLEAAEESIAVAKEVVDLIQLAVQEPKHEDYMQRLTNARIALDRLDTQQKRLVTNQRELQTHEKAVKPVLTTMVLIDKIDAELLTFVKDTTAARTAYGKLDRTQRNLVSNYDRLMYYEPVAKVVETISKIKSTSKTYHEDTQKARQLYNGLDDERRALVKNMDILVEAEKNIASAADIDALIAALPDSRNDEFLKNVANARNVYNGLSTERKKAVKNYSILVTMEKMAKPIQDVVNKIDNIFTAQDMVRQYKVVMTAYDKLTAEQRKFVYNANAFLTLTDVIKVYDKIAALKVSDPNYFGMAELVRKEYNTLSNADKQRVQNYDKLLEAEAQRKQVEHVMELIAQMSATSSQYFTQFDQVQAQYLALPTPLRKHVMNYDKLEKANKDITAARKVIELITIIDEQSTNFEKQVLAAQKAYDALTSEQRKLINNAWLLDDYLKQI